MTRSGWGCALRKRPRAATGALAVCMLLATLPSQGCAPERPPLVIGYLGGLTGRSADLGVAGRDGALLAIEEFNTAGGVDGRNVGLAVANDKQNQDAARNAFRSLVRQDALCVIGPMTSSVAVAVAPLAAQSGTPLISPTTSTDALTGKDDLFYRLYPDNSGAASELARVVRQRLGHGSCAIIYDLGNESHTKTWADNFTHEFERLDGEVRMQQPFTSGRVGQYGDAASQAIRADAECVFVLASSVDTAILATRLRAQGWTGHIIASEWSASETLVEQGGSAVEGVLFLNTIDSSSHEKRFLDFRERYVRRFGSEPGFASVHAYDATRLALSLLKEDPTPPSIADALAGGIAFRGLQGEVTLDRYGDVDRAYYLMVVRDGAFAPFD